MVGRTLMNVINFELFSSDNAIDIERQCVEIELTLLKRWEDFYFKYILIVRVLMLEFNKKKTSEIFLKNCVLSSNKSYKSVN